MAILPVLALHLKPTLPLPPPSFRWGWDHFQRNGGYGVEMFFLISGFLITKVLAEGVHGPFKPDLRNFYTKRAGRILPLFLLYVLLGLLFFVCLNDGSKKFNYCFHLPSDPWSLTFWIPLFIFLFNWAICFFSAVWQGIGAYWALAWSLAIEEQFYFFYPMILRRLKNERNLLRFLSAVVLAGILWRTAVALLPWPSWTAMGWSSFSHFDQIALGAILYFLQERHGKYLRCHGRLAASFSAGGISLMVSAYLATFNVDKIDSIYGSTLITTGLFFFLLGGINLVFFESNFFKLLTYPGKFSYGIYLFHVSVLYFIHSYLWDMNIVLAYVLFAVVCTLAAAVSFHWLETPANRWIRRKLGSASS